jgi:hypothetical protein
MLHTLLESRYLFLSRPFLRVNPLAFYHIVTNFSIGSVFGVQVTYTLIFEQQYKDSNEPFRLSYIWPEHCFHSRW